jgi:UDP-2,3-diacylglucosamine pyrophosphatase LpxH
MKDHYEIESLFLSDLHIGSKYCKIDKILETLKKYRPKHLFLIGDIFDGYRLKNKFYWSNDYNNFIRKILGLIKKNGTKVIYVTGNHDSFLRHFTDCNFGDILICDEYKINIGEDKQILVTHGDNFDTICNKMPFLFYFGDKAYSLILMINHWINIFRDKTGFGYYPISKYLKNKVKTAVNYINNFETVLAEYAKQKECTGVICGHIHNPEIKKIGDIDYYNTGDFIENCSYIIQKNFGSSLELKFA